MQPNLFIFFKIDTSKILAQISHIVLYLRDTSYFQSNIEGELIDKIQEFGFSYTGIILNAGAYTHTSIGIGDAVKAITTPVIEVHISNTFSRESFRHQSYISGNAKGVILGFGLKSYELAIQSFV